MSTSRRQNNNSTMAMTNCKSLKRRRVLLLSTAAVLSTAQENTTQPQQHRCPPELNGWAPSADCSKYYWCSSGNLASMPYDCVNGTLFDRVQLTCLPAVEVDCEIQTTTTTTITTTEGYFWTESPMTSPPETDGGSNETDAPTIAASPSTQQPGTSPPTATPTARSPTVHPTPRETHIGSAIYYPDFPSRSCLTENPPAWLTPDDVFTTKEECCSKVMNWIPLEQCLGVDWVETNYYWSPTKTPSLSPSASPSSSPSRSPSRSPSESPTLSPSLSPSSSEPTESPSLVSLCIT